MSYLKQHNWLLAETKMHVSVPETWFQTALRMQKTAEQLKAQLSEALDIMQDIQDADNNFSSAEDFLAKFKNKK